ncbi:MAG: ABC transporter substrate-binding protein, partial [Desulfurococcaceae archaeon]
MWFEEEGKVVYIKLKPNLKFADGTPVNSTAIKYTYERLLSKRAPVLGVFGQLERVEVVDELTARLVFTMPYGPVLLSLTWDFFNPLSPSYIKIVGDANFGRKALSTGPFYVVEWRAGDYIIYERN